MHISGKILWNLFHSRDTSSFITLHVGCLFSLLVFVTRCRRMFSEFELNSKPATFYDEAPGFLLQTVVSPLESSWLGPGGLMKELLRGLTKRPKICTIPRNFQVVSHLALMGAAWITCVPLEAGDRFRECNTQNWGFHCRERAPGMVPWSLHPSVWNTQESRTHQGFLGNSLRKLLTRKHVSFWVSALGEGRGVLLMRWMSERNFIFCTFHSSLISEAFCHSSHHLHLPMGLLWLRAFWA